LRLYGGVFVPLVTPFRPDGTVNELKIQHNVSRLNLLNLAGYAIGSTLAGEPQLLSFEEKCLILRTASASADRARARLVCVSEASVQEALRLIEAGAGAGCSAALLEPPYRPGMEHDLYVRTLADRSPLPLHLAARPGSQLISHPNATLMESALAPLANAVPYVFVTIYEALRTREEEAAADWIQRLEPAQAVWTKYGVPGLRYAMDLFAYHGGSTRLPLVNLNAAQRAEVTAAFEGLRG
jgi:dihydrodipicolinate synthase/N-acetylneuraminate lyase